MTAACAPPFSIENYDWHNSVGRLVALVRCGLRRNLEQELSSHGVSAQQWIILMKAAHEKDLTAADMAKSLEYDPGAMTRILDRLQDKGVIRRVRAGNDRRRILIELTPKGRKLAPILERVGLNVMNRALTGFSAQECKQLNALLLRIIDNVK